MSFEFTPENKQNFEVLLTKYPNKQAALLPALWLVQRQHGHIPLEAQEYVAGLLDLSPVHVHGVVTFYTMYKEKPTGTYHLQVCRTLSCALMGCSNIVEHLQNKHGIKDGHITADGKFSLEQVECLASCGSGPMMMVNEAYVENLTTEKIDQLIEKLANDS